jgi:hypothetical protein
LRRWGRRLALTLLASIVLLWAFRAPLSVAAWHLHSLNPMARNLTADVLVDSQDWPSMDREDVHALLGPTSMLRFGYDGWDDVFYVGPSHSHWRCLCVLYGEDGLVERVEIRHRMSGRL